MTRPDPMADGTLAALAKRVEVEEPSAKLWCDALYATLPLDLTEAIAKLNDGCEKRFIELVKLGAYLDAADMLRPETGWSLHIAEGDDHKIWAELRRGHQTSFDKVCLGTATGPHAEARARLAAALRARDAGGA